MVTALATVILAVLTAVYVWLTHKLLRAQSDPYVVVYASSDELRPSLIEIVIQNVGRAVARNVRFEFSRPMFWRAYGTTENNAVPAEEMVDGPLITGIPALAPGGMRRITWGQFGGLTKALGADTITVTTKFWGSRDRDLPPVVSELDVRSFARTDISERDPILRLFREVKKLRETLKSIEATLSNALSRNALPGTDKRRRSTSESASHDEPI